MPGDVRDSCGFRVFRVESFGFLGFRVCGLGLRIGVLNRGSYGLYSVRKGFHRLLNGILMLLCYRVLLGSLGSGFAQSYYNVVQCSCRIFGGTYVATPAGKGLSSVV